MLFTTAAATQRGRTDYLQLKFYQNILISELKFPTSCRLFSWKASYIWLYHIHIEKENATFFFAANPQDFTSWKLIVII